MKNGKWEEINEDTDRLEVPGGWLYRVRPVMDSGVYEGEIIGDVTPALCFVPGGRKSKGGSRG